MTFKKVPRDERINVRPSWIRDFLGMFLVVISINGGFLLISMTVQGIEPTLQNLLSKETISYLVFFSLLLGAITTWFRNSTLNVPMQRLSDAARRIAKGDFSVRVEPLRKDGKKDYIEVMFDDFNTMAEELSSIETMKNDFIGNVSHEIKTPIAVIQNYATVLQQPGLSEADRSEYARTIMDAAKKLSTLVTNILKLNKLENQGIVPEGTVFDLSEQLRACALGFEDLWEKKGIVFEAAIEDDVVVRSDQDMLALVWNNILSNAIKFTSPGGRVSLAMKKEEGMAVVTVSDTGCGMDEAIIRHVFDKFYQGDTSHAQEGNGLGLALVHRVIQLVGGEIRVQSEPGKGSTFTVLLKAD